MKKNDFIRFYCYLQDLINEFDAASLLIEELRIKRDKSLGKIVWAQENVMYQVQGKILLNHIVLCSRRLIELVSKTIPLADLEEICPKFTSEALKVIESIPKETRKYRNNYAVHPFNDYMKRFPTHKELVNLHDSIFDGSRTIEEYQRVISNIIFPIDKIKSLQETLYSELKQKLGSDFTDIKIK